MKDPETAMANEINLEANGKRRLKREQFKRHGQEPSLYSRRDIQSAQQTWHIINMVGMRGHFLTMYFWVKCSLN